MTRRRKARTTFVAFAIALSVAACHPARPASPPVRLKPPFDKAQGGPEALEGPDTTEDKVRVKADTTSDTLKHDIDALLAQPALAHGYWGVLVKSLKTDETLYAVNARKLMIPASNMKIVTLAAAAELLGWDYTYETTLVADGSIVNGTLNGDLIVVGTGDPSLMDGEASSRVFDGWAAQLKARGIQRVAGRIVGDDHAFAGTGLGFGWSWDDVPDDYSAGVSALQFNENAVRVTVTPGPAVGDTAGIAVLPVTSGLVIRSSVRTGEPDSTLRVETRRLPGSSELELIGSVPVGGAPNVHVVSVDNPTLFFVTALRHALIAGGIDVRGPAVDIDDITDAPTLWRVQKDPPYSTEAAPLVTYRSPPLSTLAIRLMKVSQNLYAETFLKTIGAAAGTPTAEAGRASTQSLLQGWGVQTGDLIQRDGSGLSRYDYVTPEALVMILMHVDRDQRLRGPFEAALPIAGRDGGLPNRMKGTKAEGNARAKTGSMTSVRGLSGYVTTADGEPLVFSILANNFDTAPNTITTTADAIVIRLAEFSRRPQSR